MSARVICSYSSGTKINSQRPHLAFLIKILNTRRLKFVFPFLLSLPSEHGSRIFDRRFLQLAAIRARCFQTSYTLHGKTSVLTALVQAGNPRRRHHIRVKTPAPVPVQPVFQGIFHVVGHTKNSFAAGSSEDRKSSVLCS